MKLTPYFLIFLLEMLSIIFIHFTTTLTIKEKDTVLSQILGIAI